jgi:hypothetical protein
MLLYPMVGWEIINLDISPPRPTTKRNENCFEVLAVLDGNHPRRSQKTKLQSMIKQDLVIVYLNIKSFGQGV